MEASVAVALITAVAKLGVSLIEKWTGGKAPDEKAAKFVKENYQKYRDGLGDTSVLVLRELEDGQNHSVSEIREKVYPDLALTPDSRSVLDHEFTFRLQHLRLLGLINDFREYYITRGGMAFLAEARLRHDYQRVLKPK